MALCKAGVEEAWAMGSSIICTSIVVRELTTALLAKAYARQGKRQAWRMGAEASSARHQRRFERDLNTLYLVQQKGLLLHLALNQDQSSSPTIEIYQPA